MQAMTGLQEERRKWETRTARDGVKSRVRRDSKAASSSAANSLSARHGPPMPTHADQHSTHQTSALAHQSCRNAKRGGKGVNEEANDKSGRKAFERKGASWRGDGQPDGHADQFSGTPWRTSTMLRPAEAIKKTCILAKRRSLSQRARRPPPAPPLAVNSPATIMHES